MKNAKEFLGACGAFLVATGAVLFFSPLWIFGWREILRWEAPSISARLDAWMPSRF